MYYLILVAIILPTFYGLRQDFNVYRNRQAALARAWADTEPMP